MTLATLPLSRIRPVLGASAAAFALALAACGHQPIGHSLHSARQPVVERSHYTLDLAAGVEGLAGDEQRQLAQWLASLSLGHGDRVAVAGISLNEALRADIAAIAGNQGLVLDDRPPIIVGPTASGQVRVVATRARAFVPGCMGADEHGRSDRRLSAFEDFGCSVNGNLAAMVADPAHLLTGARAARDPVATSATKAIEAYRRQEPTGAAGLPRVSTGGDR